jgi:hypothetical protein
LKYKSPAKSRTGNECGRNKCRDDLQQTPRRLRNYPCTLVLQPQESPLNEPSSWTRNAQRVALPPVNCDCGSRTQFARIAGRKDLLRHLSALAAGNLSPDPTRNVWEISHVNDQEIGGRMPDDAMTVASEQATGFPLPAHLPRLVDGGAVDHLPGLAIPQVSLLPTAG